MNVCKIGRAITTQQTLFILLVTKRLPYHFKEAMTPAPLIHPKRVLFQFFVLCNFRPSPFGH
jgi:hypothetical protein